MSRCVTMPSTTPAAAKAEALKVSRANPGKYITIDEVFGTLYIHIESRLPIFAPSDAHPALKFYILRGKIKPFTEAQIIACQNATPTMS